MTSKSMKPSRPARPEQLTQEERDQATLRSFIQKREQIAVTVLAGIVHNPNFADTKPESLAEFSVATADAMLMKLYGGNPAAEKEAEKE